MTTEFAVSVKPWWDKPIEKLALHVQKLGFNLIELPVQPGFPCEPETIAADLAQAKSILDSLGIRILNVMVDLPLDDERLYVACAENGIKMNRVIFQRQGRGYWEVEADVRQQLDRALPLCEQYGVQIGVQHYYDNAVPINSMGLYNLVKEYDTRYVGAIWDAANNALQGEDPQSGLEIVQSQLCMINLNNAYWRRTSLPGASAVTWAPYFSAGKQGRSDWYSVAMAVAEIGYSGPLTFSAEYSDDTYTDRLLAEDLAYAKVLFNS